MSARENGWYWLTDDFGNHLLCRWLSADRKLVGARFDYRESAMPHEASELSPVATPAEVAALRAEVEQAHSYLARLLQNTHPQCEPLPDLRGLCTQIDNMVTEIPKLRAEVERLKGGIADAMRAVLAAIIPAIQAEALELAAAKCETHDWGKDVSWWLSATKKDVAAEAGRQCAAAIRALKEGT